MASAAREVFLALEAPDGGASAPGGGDRLANAWYEAAP